MNRRVSRVFSNRTKRAEALARALKVETPPPLNKCPTGKRKYLKKERAKAAAKRHSATFGIPHRIYRCRRCGLFHETTKGAGINPENGLREDPARALKAPPTATLAGTTVKRMVKRA